MLQQFAGPVDLFSGHEVEAVISLLSVLSQYILFPILILLWVIFLMSRYAFRKNSYKLLRFNKIMSVVVLVLFTLRFIPID